MTAADRGEVAREALRAAVARAVDDSGGDLLDHLEAAYLGEDADAQVIAFALEALGRRLTERAVAAQVAAAALAAARTAKADRAARAVRRCGVTCAGGCVCGRREAGR